MTGITPPRGAVTITTTPRIGSLCSGYGGLDMGVQSVLGGTVAWHVEYDRDPSKILAHHWPDVPNFGDLKNVDWEDERVMGAPRADALAQLMYDRYCQGLSIEQVAAEFGRSRQTVHKMFQRRGWQMRPVYASNRLGVDYGGLRYTLGDLGYLRCTTGDRHYLHRRVWEDANGRSVPPDHDVHHVDHNKLNNDPSNLRLLTKAEHTRLHAEEVVPTDSPAVDILTAGYP